MSNARTGTAALILLTALSLSVGWGIRGNFGHEYGAMIPGALAAMAAALLSGRDDWWPRTAYFGFFGALGWSLGGSISYMQVIAYTHSGDSASVLYGFACLFVIGFLWAAMGGAGAGLAACLDREQLTEFFAPLTAVFVAWCFQDVLAGLVEPADSQFRQSSPLYWYDTDWLAALSAILAVGCLALVRRRWDRGSSLILHMAIGWWLGFLLLVVVLGLRMTPSRGDNWAGCLGMAGGLWWYLRRRGWSEVTLASVLAGLVGGFGFATATMLKLVEMKSGWQANWHSILEQTYGFFNGIGMALAMIFLAQRAKRVANEPRVRRWTDVYAVGFILLVITYVNLRKNPSVWVQSKALPAVLYGLSATVWFDLAYAILALVAILLLSLHQRRRLPVVPDSPLGQGQLLYTVFLWWMVIGNFERALVSFAPQRLATEGVIHLNAALCTLLVLACATPRSAPSVRWPATLGGATKRLATLGLAGFALCVLLDWAIVRGLYGDQFAGQARLHVRFGPNATATSAKPRTDQPHP